MVVIESFRVLKISKLFKTNITIKIECFRNRDKILLKLRNDINKYSLNIRKNKNMNNYRI